MRIIESFICYLEEIEEFIKIHRGRDKQGNDKYFAEYREGIIEPISQEDFQKIKD